MWREGILCEVLSWKMDVEEAKAAIIISQAMNNPHHLAMQASGLTPVAALKGETIVQPSKDVSQYGVPETVRDRVLNALQQAAI